jgi:hypothetical protein
MYNIIKDITYLYKYNSYKFSDIKYYQNSGDSFIGYGTSVLADRENPVTTYSYWVNKRSILDHVNRVFEVITKLQYEKV